MVPAQIPGLHRDLNAAGRSAARRVRAGCAILRREGNPRREQAITFAHLGKLNPISKVHLVDLVVVWQSLIATAGPTLPALVIGLTESGIIPSFTMHHACLKQGQSSQWMCTSRIRPSKLTFQEPHSHAPVHYLPVELRGQRVEEIWIVEDEITTGRTLLNLLQTLRSHLEFKRYRIFALLDSRTAKARSSFDTALRRQGLFGRVDAMMSIDQQMQTNHLDRGPSDLGWSTTGTGHFHERSTRMRPMARVVYGEDLAAVLPSVLLDPAARIQQATLSPWSIDGWHVRTRRPLPGNLYLYNQP